MFDDTGLGSAMVLSGLEDRIRNLENLKTDKLKAKLERCRAALERANTVLQLITIGQVIDAGDRAIEAAGLNPYCLNEGRANRDDKLHPDFVRAALAETDGE